MTWNSVRLLALVIFLPAFCVALPEKHSGGATSLSGVVKGGSGATIALHLEPVTESPVRYYDGYETVPREDGSFTFSVIPPGEYRLTVDGSTFVPPIPSAPPGATVTLRVGDDRDRRQAGGFTVNLPADMPSGIITLHSGEVRKGLVIELSHKLSFCGHVTHDIAPIDAWGRKTGPSNIVPSDTSINFLHFDPEFGILDNETKFDTDKDGSFHVTDLAPGTYYVRSFETWFPGTGSFAGAKPVVVGSEPAEGCKVEIQQIANNSCTVGDIFGEIHSDPSVDKNQYGITFLNRNGEDVSVSGTYGEHPPFRKLDPHSAGDSFLVQLCAGGYDVVLSEKQHAGNNLWGSAPVQKIVFDTQHVTIAPNGAAHIVLTPHAMASIEGEVLLDKVTREEFCPNCQTVYVSILREGNGEFQTVTLSSGNHFDFRNVTPGDYQIFVTATRLDKVYLKSISTDGVEGKGSHFTVREPKFVSMTVTLSGDVAQAEGHASPDVRHAKRWQTEGMRPAASVAGKVDGESSAVYTVRLLPVGYNSNAETNLTVQTGADGSFDFENVPPGIYRLRGHDKDYVRFDYGAKAVELRGEPLLIAPGAKIRNLTLNAPRRSFSGSICGHLTDTNGNSRTMRIWFRSLALKPNQQAKEVSTDNDGYFRMDGLPEGDYLLQAPDMGRTLTLSGDGKLDASAPVHLEDGRNLGCGANPPLELHFPVNGGTVHSISGSVNGDLPARLGDRFLVELKDLPDFGIYGSARSDKLNTDHKFHLENVPAGRYTLNVYGVYGPEPKPESGFRTYSGPGAFSEPLRHLIASQPITVSDQDIAGITMTPLMLPSVTGAVRIPRPPSNWKDFKPSSLSLKLVPHRKNGPLIAPLTDKAESEGEFAIGAADAGEYEIQIQAADPRHAVSNVLYVASAKLNGKDVNPRFFTLPPDGDAKLDVELGDEMAAVHAKVLPDKSFPMPGVPLNERCGGPGILGRYTVILYPDPLVSPSIDSEPEQASHLFQAWTLDADCRGIMNGVAQYWDGRIQDIPPGKYYAIATRDSNISSFGLANQGRSTAEQRKFLGALAAIAEPITLHGGESLELNLTDKTIDASRVAARVGVADEVENLRPQNNQSCCSH